MLDGITFAECAEAVKGPGKFEGESPATYYFWRCYMEGDGEALESVGRLYTIHEVEPDEAAIFGLTEPFYAISESEQGFVTGSEESEESVRAAREAEEESYI